MSEGPTDVVRITAPEPPPSVVHSEFIGDLHFETEYPATETVDKLFDQLDFQRACQVFLRNITASSMYSFRHGLRRDLGVDSASKVAIWEDGYNATSLLLTPNSETLYGTTYLDLAADGPTVLEIPPGMLGFSTTCGCARSPTSARPVPTKALAAGSSPCRLGTTVLCRRSASMSSVPVPTACGSSSERSGIPTDPPMPQ